MVPSYAKRRLSSEKTARINYASAGTTHCHYAQPNDARSQSAQAGLKIKIGIAISLEFQNPKIVEADSIS